MSAFGVRVQPVTATPLAGALRRGARAISDRHCSCSSARATSATHWPLFQHSQSSALCFGVNHRWSRLCASWRVRLQLNLPFTRQRLPRPATF